MTGPPDENIVALVATLVSFAIILPLLMKWWPKSIPKPGRKRRPGERPAAASSRPAAKTANRPASPPGRSARPAPRVVRPKVASGRPRRPS